MVKAFALIPVVGRVPDIDKDVTPYTGFALCAIRAGSGAYIISGTGPQLKAIDELPGVIGLVAVTDSGNVHWPELSDTISVAIIAKLNKWLTAHELPNIPERWSYRRVIVEVFTRINPHFVLNEFDIIE